MSRLNRWPKCSLPYWAGRLWSRDATLPQKVCRRWTWLNSEPGQLQLHVRALPGLVELAAHVEGLLTFPLSLEGLFKAEQTPGVARPTLEDFAEDLLLATTAS